MSSDETQIEDDLYFGDLAKLKSEWNKDTSVTGRTIYFTPFAFEEDVSVEFKLNNNPSNVVLGFGRVINGEYRSKIILHNNLNKSILWWQKNNSTQKYEWGSNILLSSKPLVKFTTSNINTISLYIDDVIKGYRDTDSSEPLTLRLDDFTSSPVDLEYIKVKKL